MDNLRGWFVFLGFAAIIGYLMANGHTVHVLSVMASRPLVILNSFVFIIFAFRFAKPESKRYWRSMTSGFFPRSFGPSIQMHV